MQLSWTKIGIIFRKTPQITQIYTDLILKYRLPIRK